MECAKCKKIIEKDSKFCHNYGEKIKTLEIKEDIGSKIIEEMEKLVDVLDKKAKDEKEKQYPCPHCNEKITIEQLKNNTRREVLGKTDAQ